MVSPYWALALGIMVLAVPTLISLGQQTWSTEAGAHAPIVLATGLWLFSKSFESFRALRVPGSFWLVVLAIAVSIVFYVFGRAYDFISLEAIGFAGVLMAIVYRLVGLRAMAANAFPFIYMAFLIPIPGWVIDQLTAPLQTLVSAVVTNGLYSLGYPVVREGVTLFIAQYQLLVEEACSGMNSITGLISISLFYIYVVHRASWRHALVLLLFVVPIAIVVNMIRVLALVLLTYYYGDAVAQGFLHVTSGVVLFAVAIMLVFCLDLLLRRFVFKPAEPAGS